MRQVLFAGGAALLAMTVLGCGSKVGDIQGTVTLDGKPIENGSIAFVSTGPTGHSAGAPITAGKYEVRDCPVGKAKAIIHASIVVGKARTYNTPDSPVEEMVREGVPPRYNDHTELTYDVEPGKNEKNFDLKTGG